MNELSYYKARVVSVREHMELKRNADILVSAVKVFEPFSVATAKLFTKSLAGTRISGSVTFTYQLDMVKFYMTGISAPEDLPHSMMRLHKLTERLLKKLYARRPVRWQRFLYDYAVPEDGQGSSLNEQEETK